MKGGAGDEMSGSKDQQGCPGLPGEIAEAVPGRTGDAAQFLERVEEKIEDEPDELKNLRQEAAEILNQKSSGGGRKSRRRKYKKKRATKRRLHR